LKSNCRINIKLVIAYEGTNYVGWQKTPFGTSIEGTLQQAIETIVQEPIKLQAASRTDTGVHARGQVVNFLTHKQFDIKKLQIGINSLLPKEVVVLDGEFVEADFHPTLDCVGKEYHYYICNTPFQYPEYCRFSWHVHQKLNFDLMQKAALFLVGEHDFSAFCNVKKNEAYTHHIRRIDKLEVIPIDDCRYCIKMCGNHFLYKMARNIAGIAVDVGRGKISFEELPIILDHRDRKKGGVTAPAHGLFLHQIFYAIA
jgi:tRNA pseudouridine38-40 synthase